MAVKPELYASGAKIGRLEASLSKLFSYFQLVSDASRAKSYDPKYLGVQSRSWHPSSFQDAMSLSIIKCLFMLTQSLTLTTVSMSLRLTSSAPVVLGCECETIGVLSQWFRRRALEVQ